MEVRWKEHVYICRRNITAVVSGMEYKRRLLDRSCQLFAKIGWSANDVRSNRGCPIHSFGSESLRWSDFRVPRQLDTFTFAFHRYRMPMLNAEERRYFQIETDHD